MGIWIGLGIFTLVILIIILWLLHKPVEIALFLVYSKSEKVATILITGLFTNYATSLILPQGEQFLDQLTVMMNENHKRKKQTFYRQTYEQLMDLASSLKMKEFKWKTVFGLSKANETAILYGVGYSIKHACFHGIKKYVKSTTIPEIAIEPNFHQTEFETNFSCIFFAPFGHIIGNLRKLKSIVNEVDNYE